MARRPGARSNLPPYIPRPPLILPPGMTARWREETFDPAADEYVEGPIVIVPDAAIVAVPGDAATDPPTLDSTEIDLAAAIDAAIATAAPDDFTDLGDTPAVYTGDGGDIVRVKADETGLEFTGPHFTVPASIFTNTVPQFSLGLPAFTVAHNIDFEMHNGVLLYSRWRLNTASNYFEFFGNFGSSRVLAYHLGAPANSLTIDATGSTVLGTGTAHASAKLDVTATNRGFLPPRMTSAQRLAISNPAQGLTVYDTTLLCMMMRGERTWEPLSKSHRVRDIADDFVMQANSGVDRGEAGWQGLGGPITTLTAETNHPGIIRITTTAADSAIYASPGANGTTTTEGILFGSWILRLSGAARVSAGFSSNVITLSPNNGIKFQYNPSLHANWRVQSFKAGVKTVDANTGVAVAAGTWYRLEIVYNGTGSVTFFINGVGVATVTSGNLPAAAQALMAVAHAQRVSSTITVDLDYVRLILAAPSR